MIKNKLIFTAFVCLIVSGNIFAQDKFGFGRDNRPMELMRKVFSRLDLSEEQKQSIWLIRSENQDSMQSIKSSIRPLKQQLHNILSAENVDEMAVKVLTAEIAELKSDQIILMSSIKKQIFALLNDVQKTKLEKMKEMYQKRRDSDF